MIVTCKVGAGSAKVKNPPNFYIWLRKCPHAKTATIYPPIQLLPQPIPRNLFTADVPTHMHIILRHFRERIEVGNYELSLLDYSCDVDISDGINACTSVLSERQIDGVNCSTLLERWIEFFGFAVSFNK